MRKVTRKAQTGKIPSAILLIAACGMGGIAVYEWQRARRRQRNFDIIGERCGRVIEQCSKMLENELTVNEGSFRLTSMLWEIQFSSLEASWQRLRESAIKILVQDDRTELRLSSITAYSFEGFAEADESLSNALKEFSRSGNTVDYSTAQTTKLSLARDKVFAARFEMLKRLKEICLASNSKPKS